MKFDPQLTVLVASCDKYADILPAFSVLFRKYWPDCPFEVVLVTEYDPGSALHAPSSESQAPGATPCFNRVIACGDERRWGTRLAMALKQITTPRVLMLCDDYFLCDRVDTALINRRLEQSLRFKALNLRLLPNPLKYLPFQEGLGEYPKNVAYCISTLAGIWDHDFLLKLADGVGSIWEFERYNSFQIGGETRPLLCTPTKEFPFLDSLHKGYWERFGLANCAANGIVIDTAKRGLPPLNRRMVEWIKGVIFRMNPTLLVKVQNRLHLGAT